MVIQGLKFISIWFCWVTCVLYECLAHFCFFLQVGLKGEAMNLGSPSSTSAVNWTRLSIVAKNQQPLTWYKVWNKNFKYWLLTEHFRSCSFRTIEQFWLIVILNPQANFDAPEGDEPLALDMGSMGKGQVWINGQSIGRYWTLQANGNCSVCSYSGTFRPNKCQFGCLHPTQQWFVTTSDTTYP